MTLREKQSLFASLIPKLILYIYEQGYEVTLGDAYAKDGHSKNSKHYDRLAMDLNLFLSGKYLTSTDDHRFAGVYWKTLHPECTWGGDFRREDGNHYSLGEHND